MNYFNRKTDIRRIQSAVTLGKFDGLHIGHQKLIECIRKEKQHGMEAVLFTFSSEDFREASILTEEERRIKAQNLGIDTMIVWPFDRATAQMEPETFVREILAERLDAREVAVGRDFRFGHNRAGDTALLERLQEKYGYHLTVLDKVQWLDYDVSSTRIRDFLKAGKLEAVNAMLGTPYAISGTVLHGRKLGRTLGMPTINLVPPEGKLLPPFGVYSSMTEVEGEWYPGVTNIGIKPSVGAEPAPGAETYLFGVDRDLYGKEVTVALFHWQRSEKKFGELEQLKKQMHLDIVHAWKYLKEKGLAD